MKNNKLTVASGSYRSPEVTVAEIYSEGVLCVSNGTIEGWDEADSFTWDE